MWIEQAAAEWRCCGRLGHVQILEVSVQYLYYIFLLQKVTIAFRHGVAMLRAPGAL